jgi:hypothetical protein
MFNIKNEVVRLMHATRENLLCISSNAINTFACAVGYEDCARDRESLRQPTLVTLRDEHGEWYYYMRLLGWTTKRAVIAVIEGWLEAPVDDDGKLKMPMAIVYEMIDEELFVTEAVLHHSRSGKARLCSADLTQEYVHYCDGTAGWQMLPKAFKKRAAVGVQRAGERWLCDYDALDTYEWVAAMQKNEDKESQPVSVQLPGVILTMGRWCKSAADGQAT